MLTTQERSRKISKSTTFVGHRARPLGGRDNSRRGGMSRLSASGDVFHILGIFPRWWRTPNTRSCNGTRTRSSCTRKSLAGKVARHEFRKQRTCSSGTKPAHGDRKLNVRRTPHCRIRRRKERRDRRGRDRGIGGEDSACKMEGRALNTLRECPPKWYLARAPHLRRARRCCSTDKVQRHSGAVGVKLARSRLVPGLQRKSQSNSDGPR